MNFDNGPVEAYNNSHRAFLQAFLARSTMTFEEAKPILAKIESIHDRATHENDIQEADFNRYIRTINAQLSPLDYEIRHIIPQNDESRTKVYSLVNTTSDAQTQLATTLSADEVAFVKRVIDAMFETYGGGGAGGREVFAVPLKVAINLAKVPRSQARDSGMGVDAETQGQQTQGASASSITLQRAEAVLDQLVEGRWFDKSRNNFYSLGPRGLMELKSWLQETYDEPVQEGDTPEDIEAGKRIRFCAGCKDILTVGQRCANHDCTFRLHGICIQRFFRGADKTCPKCGTTWEGQNHPVGEKASREYTGSRASGARQSGTQGRRSTTVADEEDDAVMSG